MPSFHTQITLFGDFGRGYSRHRWYQFLKPPPKQNNCTNTVINVWLVSFVVSGFPPYPHKGLFLEILLRSKHSAHRHLLRFRRLCIVFLEYVHLMFSRTLEFIYCHCWRFNQYFVYNENCANKMKDILYILWVFYITF